MIFNAQRYGMAPDEYFKRLQDNNQVAAIFSDVRRGKALAGAVEKATVTSESGEVLDVAALFGIEVDDSDAAEAAAAGANRNFDTESDDDLDVDQEMARAEIDDDEDEQPTPSSTHEAELDGAEQSESDGPRSPAG